MESLWSATCEWLVLCTPDHSWPFSGVARRRRFDFAIESILVLSLSPAGLAATLNLIWLVKPETTSRVKRRCDTVMTWCAAHGHVQASPVNVVKQFLLKQPGKCEQGTIQPAVSWQGVPALARFQDVLR